jgi:hypothetical protein
MASVLKPPPNIKDLAQTDHFPVVLPIDAQIERNRVAKPDVTSSRFVFITTTWSSVG